MTDKERIEAIKRKQVFETGSEKEFIRAKDIIWLINQAERALKNAQDLEDMDKQLAGEQKRVRDLEKELKETITKKNRHLREKDKKIKKLEWKSMIHERSHSDTYSRLFERNEECKLLKEKTEKYEKALRKIDEQLQQAIEMWGNAERACYECKEIVESVLEESCDDYSR